MKSSSRIIAWLASGILLFIWIMVIRSYGALPTSIPIHFAASGKADNWGPKASIWFLPFLASAMYGLFTLLHRYAHKLPRKTATDPDPEGSLATLRGMFAQLRLSIMIVMAIGIYGSLLAAFNAGSMEPAGIVPFIILVMFTPVLIFLFRMTRKKASS